MLGLSSFLAFLLLTAGRGIQSYVLAYDSVISSEGYNDTYDFLYGYDLSYFANLHDPYDDSKSWSIEADQQCENGHCIEAVPQDSLDPFNSAGFTPATPVDTLYAYDSCAQAADGSYVINGTSDCPLEIHGIDAAADLLVGGADGTYHITGCFEGKPMYQRVTDHHGEKRTLYYHPYMGDWELSIGQEVNEDALVMYGDLGYVSPLDVPRWHVSASLSRVESQRQPEDEDLYFIFPDVTVTCVGEMPAMKQERDLYVTMHSHRQRSIRLKEEHLVPDDAPDSSGSEARGEGGHSEVCDVDEVEE